jgi:hypothetical protein
MIGTAVPDLSWSIKDILVSGDQISKAHWQEL